MKIRTKESRPDTNHLQMSSMIDIVFLLLVFFIMTFKIVAQEGDLEMLGPVEAGSGISSDPSEKVLVELLANDEGDLRGIQVGERKFEDFHQLNQFIVELAPPENHQTLDVTIHSDYQLRYQHAIDALEAVTGLRGNNGEVLSLEHTVRFTSPN